VFGTADDISGSAGVARRNASNVPIADSIFGFARQVTPRSAPNFFGGGLWDSEVFWDGRAGSQFRDPLTNAVAIASGGALENQSLAPILSDVEMSKEGRTWAEVTASLAQMTPMVSAANLPADMANALAANPTYPDLFEEAFGDPAITPARIAFAIASYERTLVPNQTPWDRFQAGDTSALDATQQTGQNVFMGSNCAVCHAPPLFTDLSFRNIGVRPNSDDLGRQVVTSDPADRGKFETPTLRNVGLKPTFMHNGRITTLTAVIAFYQAPGSPNTDNRDPLVPSPIQPNQQTALRAFINAGLIDPRVQAQTSPFDRPTLLPEPGVAASLLAGALCLARLARRPRDGSA
jgi:cytochrome c peroxidase